MIEKVDEATKEVVVQAKKEKMTFPVGENTRITEATAKKPLSSLKKGMQVTVEYEKERNKFLAEWIDVHMAKAKAKPFYPRPVPSGRANCPVPSERFYFYHSIEKTRQFYPLPGGRE